MEIIVKNGNSGSDKLEGEFRVPFSFGTGSNIRKWVCCENCGEAFFVKITTKGFVCSKCNKYNGDMNKCEAKFKELESELFTENSVHIRDSDKNKMINFRDAMALKADLYKNGISRENLGGQKYRKKLKSAMKENHINTMGFKI